MTSTNAAAANPPAGRRHTAGFVLLAVTLMVAGTACRAPYVHPTPPAAGRVMTVVIETTAYCACQSCCGWEYDRHGRPVYAYGPSKGKPKEVGICADGTRARPGTIAADTRYYPFGTRMSIPGYGAGVVHDRGGAITGPRRIDLYFNSHEAAVRWGRRRLPVQIRLPPNAR